MKTWTTVDKSKWPLRGEWDQEPDKAHWIDEKSGLDCLIARNSMGALCGYVGIPETHPLFGKPYDDVSLSAHGGLTFADRWDLATENVWWFFGFDCSHSRDLKPAFTMFVPPRFSHLLKMWDETYRNFEYVKSEVESLAAQLMDCADKK